MRLNCGLVLLCMLAAPAVAQPALSWRTVTLDGGGSIDVPAQLAGNYRPAGAPAGALLGFQINAGDPGSMACQMKRVPYAKDAPRQTLLPLLAPTSKTIGDFCKVAGAQIHAWQLGSAAADKTDGVPSGHCLSAYTDGGQQAAGKVMTVKMVAGKQNLYQLVCISQFDDQDGAVTAYATRWNDIVNRLQQSLKLPAGEK